MSEPLLPAPVSSQDSSQHPRISTDAITTVRSNTAEQLQYAEKTAHIAFLGLPSTDYDLYAYRGPYWFPDGSYLKYVGSVTRELPILHPLLEKSTDPSKLDIMVLDIKEDGTCLEPKIFGITNSIYQYRKAASVTQTPLGYTALGGFLKEPKPSDVSVRLFLVEDLSPAIIEALGFGLKLDPIFFANHLDNCDYATPRGVLPKRRSKAGKQFFFSSSWKRPASQITWTKVSGIFPSRKKLSNPGDDEFPKVNNIYRPHDSMIKNLDRDIVMAEERMSFLVRNDNHGWTGVFLFDPLREYRRLRSLSFREGKTIKIFDDPIDILGAYHTRIFASIPSFEDFDSYEETPKSEGGPRTRIQFLNYITRMKSSRTNSATNGVGPIDVGNPSAFLVPMFRFMLSDWDILLGQMENHLNKIDILMSDNTSLQRNLVTWRIELGVWRKSLVEDYETTQMTLGIARQLKLEDLAAEFENTGTRITSMRDRTERSFNVLMSSMAIVESGKVMSQTESLSRLTELAFFFIPLSFATSLFGMQIPGWSENYRPHMWFATSISLVLGAYAFRILVRSRIIQYLTESVSKSVRNFADLPPGARIPTSNYLMWFFLKSWVVLFLIALTGVSFVVLIIIWKHNLSASMKAWMTVLASFVELVLMVGVCRLVWLADEEDERSVAKRVRWEYKVIRSNDD